MVSTGTPAARTVRTVATSPTTASEAQAEPSAPVLSREELESYADCLLTDAELAAEINELDLR